MGIFEKKKTEFDAPVTEAIQKGTYIDEGVNVFGDFVSDEVIEINGTVEGNIKSSKLVRVCEKGSQKGSIDAPNVSVDGTVDSDVFCSDTASFGEGATFTGELSTINFEAARGSNFRGKLNLIGPEDVRKHNKESN